MGFILMGISPYPLNNRHFIGLRLTDTALKETEAKLHEVDKIYKARLTLLKNKDVYKQFLNSPNRKKFREEHSAEIMLYEAARRELQELTVQISIPKGYQSRANSPLSAEACSI